MINQFTEQEFEDKRLQIIMRKVDDIITYLNEQEKPMGLSNVVKLKYIEDFNGKLDLKATAYKLNEVIDNLSGVTPFKKEEKIFQPVETKCPICAGTGIIRNIFNQPAYCPECNKPMENGFCINNCKSDKAKLAKIKQKLIVGNFDINELLEIISN